MSLRPGSAALQLTETQAAFRDAVVKGDGAAAMTRLAGRGDVAYRLSIHQRHFEASLVTVLAGRYPTLEWLLGSAFLTAAAAAFARAHPPARPCMAEYGEAFPGFVAARPEVRSMPWLADVGALEWHLGAVAVEVSRPAVPLAAFAAFDNVDLEAVGIALQPGLRYLEAGWPVDALVKLRLAGDPPERLDFRPETVCLEIRGARGDFAIKRLAPAALAFRATLAAGCPLADALAAGSARAAAFDPGAALAALFAEGLVTGIANLEEEKAA